jgi:hypothetical protein
MNFKKKELLYTFRAYCTVNSRPEYDKTKKCLQQTEGKDNRKAKTRLQ